MSRTDAVTVQWHPEFRDGVAVPVVETMTIGDHRFVVIDPEDRQQVRHLLSAYHGWKWDVMDAQGPCINDMQAALRTIIEPPKPEEPTDPKAIVTDRRENVWRLLADGEWVCTCGPDIGEYLVWAHLTERGPLSIEVRP